MGTFIRIGISAAVLATSFSGVPVFDGTPLGTSAAHAEHRDYRRYRRHHDNFDFGDAVVGGLVVGGLIAVLSSASKKKREEEANRPLDSGWEPQGDWRRGNDWSWIDRDWNNRTNEERTAIATCGREAEDLGSRYGREARVREIGDVDRDGGEYRVKGLVEVRGDDRDRSAAQDRQEFICYVRDDRISDFRFQDAYAGG